MRRRQVPPHLVAVAASLLICSLLIGVGSALALRPAALTPGILGSASSPAPSPSASPVPSGTPSPVSSPPASPGVSSSLGPPALAASRPGLDQVPP